MHKNSKNSKNAKKPHGLTNNKHSFTHIYHHVSDPSNLESSHRKNRIKRLLHVGAPSIMIIGLILITITLTIVFRETTIIMEQSLQVKYGAVATDSPLCSSLASRLMRDREGANAVDASIAAALCLGTVRPFASGIGGGGFMNLYMRKQKKQQKKMSENYDGGENRKNEKMQEKEKEKNEEEEFVSDFINFREMAPGASYDTMFKDRYERSVTGGLSVAVPGEIAGFWEAHQAYGSLPWADLFADSIRLAREGIEIDLLFEMRLEQNREQIFNSPTLKQTFTRWDEKTGKNVLLQRGDVWKRPQYAQTLERIAREGISAFYQGSIAQALVNQVQGDGGILTMEDMRTYTVERVNNGGDGNARFLMSNFTSEYQEFLVVTGPPPSSGSLINFMLNILDKYDLDVPSDAFDYAQKYHYIFEVLKFGFTHRMALGDQMSPENVTFVLGEHILNRNYAKQLADFKIEPQTTHPWHHYFFDGYMAEIKDQGTSHISVIDKDRNAVSLTTTVNHSFGSKLINLETGIVLNNQMNDFTVDMHKKNEFGIPPSSANVIQPRRRPQSSMAPTILLDKETKLVKMVVGASGGPTILSSIIQVIVSIQDFHLDTYNAVNMPRFHVQPPLEHVLMEPGIVKVILDGLKSRGHVFELTKLLADGHSIGNVQVVRVNNQNILEAASDGRKHGKPAGY